MTFALHGIPVSKGIAIGKAVLISRAALEVSHYLIEAGKEELEAQKLINAFEQVRLELEQLRYGLPKDAPGEMAAFLDVHGMILADPALAEKPLKLIRSQRLNAAWALTTELNDLLEQFSEIEDIYLKERANDIRQVAERVLKALKSGEKESTEDPELALFGEVDVDAIIVAHDIAPHDMLRFKDRALTGFVTDLGGKTSHTAIVARSMEIPAVVGVRHASEMIRHGDWLILDGEHGVVIVAPDEQLLSEYRSLRAQALEDTRQLQQLKHSKTRTLDGVDISLFANIELPEDATQAVEVGAVGVGLFRSEFLFMDRNQALPDEEKQYQEYRRVVELMHGLPVNIRTIDVGADKALGAGTDLSQTGTSPLGLRAIRWSLTEPEIFLTQLRAILRASAHGQARIMIPMLAHAKEIDETLRLIEKAKQQLHQRGKAFNPNIQVGAMIEIPAKTITGAARPVTAPAASILEATFAGVAPMTSVKMSTPLPEFTPLAASSTRSKLILVSSCAGISTALTPCGITPNACSTNPNIALATGVWATITIPVMSGSIFFQVLLTKKRQHQNPFAQ